MVSTEVVEDLLSLAENQLVDSFKIYPNPTNDKIYIFTNTGVNIEKVKVYSVSGKLFLENNGIKEINLKSFPKGLYFLNIVSGEGNFTKKIIKK